DSDIYDNMDDNNLLQIDETNEIEEVHDNVLILTIPTNNELLNNKQISKK
ncbi:37941_t:CDS:1, partial [Gigaspora margarita]